MARIDRRSFPSSAAAAVSRLASCVCEASSWRALRSRLPLPMPACRLLLGCWLLAVVCPGGARATNVSLALPIDVTIAELSTAATQLIDPGNSGGHCGEVQPDGDTADHAAQRGERGR